MLFRYTHLTISFMTVQKTTITEDLKVHKARLANGLFNKKDLDYLISLYERIKGPNS